jgi:hypothetical protein
LNFSGRENLTKILKQEDITMKTKAIIATGLVTLALLAGCNKAEEPATTKTQESTSTTTVAPAGEPAATTTQESTSTTTTAPATEGK